MRRSPSWSVLIAAVVAAALSPGAANATSSPALATGTGGAVASMDASASRAGIEALRSGGNAVDAAVATGSAMGVSIPFVAGPGGGGFMVVYLARSHRVVTLDGREACPAACTASLFLDPTTHQPLAYDYASDQPLATGVPSMVALWNQAVRGYGRSTLAADLRPAISLARRGFRVNRDFVQLTQAGLTTLRDYAASRRLLLTPAGDPLPVGTRLRNPDLAHTYALLARQGARAFYDGPIGRAVVQADDHPVLAPGASGITRLGIMSAGDLRAYRVRTLAPTHVRYRGLDVYGMAPPSSGGSTEGEILNILSGYDLGREPRAEAIFHYLEASRLAYADRNAYVGDPRYVHVPLAGLLSPRFAASRRCLIGATALSSPAPAGNPLAPVPCADAGAGAAAAPEAHHTNNIVTTDRWGDIAVYTNTINFFGGSGEVVPGYGFLLNDELTDFDFAPARPGASDPNLPAAGKEPRSSIGPIVALRRGRPQFAIGAAGGSTIPTTVVQTLINHVDFGQPLAAALAAPRASQTNKPTTSAEPAFFTSPLAAELTSRYGERFAEATGSVLPLDYYPGDATALQILGGGRAQAIAEPTRLYGGSAMAVHPAR